MKFSLILQTVTYLSSIMSPRRMSRREGPGVTAHNGMRGIGGLAAVRCVQDGVGSGRLTCPKVTWQRQ